MSRRVLIIDNYDSFTYNLVQRLWELDASLDVRVVRNDEITPDQAAAIEPTHCIISPGPCTPTESGVSNDIINRLAGNTPILGVCLGHQCIGFTHGMTVQRHTRIMHGKTSLVHHDGRGIFDGLSNPFIATRYHSLVVTADADPPAGWEISAWSFETDDTDHKHRVIMGLRSTASDPPIDGVQFHPESFLTLEGPMILANFLGMPRPTLTHDPALVAAAAPEV
ncbi:MAG: aminodeoxychorismate/anthranilate synthase component II [Planctomycetota bacterium]